MNRYLLLSAFALLGCNVQSAPGPSVANFSMISAQFQDAWNDCVTSSYQRALKSTGSKNESVNAAFSDCKSQEDEVLQLDIEHRISFAAWQRYKSQVRAKLIANGAVSMR
jgi:hypothetical protein